jgi:hypothetical protein
LALANVSTGRREAVRTGPARGSDLIDADALGRAVSGPGGGPSHVGSLSNVGGSAQPPLAR